MALRESIIAASLALLMVGAEGHTQPQQTIPDAPRPQPKIPVGNVTPGEGSSSTSDTDTSAAPAAAATPAVPAATPAQEAAATAEDEELDNLPIFIAHVNYVIIPFTVKDSKNRLVAGLHSRDIQVFENGYQQNVRFFSADPVPMSVALVIDQSMTSDDMNAGEQRAGRASGRVYALRRDRGIYLQQELRSCITDFTGAQSPRLTQAIERSKGTGREALMAGSLSGPMSQTNIINGQNVDPNTAANARPHAACS